jgi:hypothetical protein
MGGFLTDIRFALRQSSRNRLFSLVFVMLLALGIGANTIIFSFVDSLLLKWMPVRNPQNLYLLEKVREREVRPDTELHYRQYQQLAKELGLFTGIVAEQSQDARDAIADALRKEA